MESAMKAGNYPTATQQLEFEASIRDSPSRVLKVAGSTAEIRVEGVLTAQPNWMARFFGGGNTTYPEIQQAIAEAEADPSVTELVFAINSGGGQISGLFDTLAAIEGASKPTRSVVGGMAASAAYAIAAVTGKIEARNKASMLGSVGVAVAMRVDDTVVEITSTNAPDKRPDVTTDEGKAVVRKELDAIHDIFVDAIAGGRKTKVSTINAEFGQGATLLAGEALKRGMIDSISGSVPTTTKTKTASKPETSQTMDLEKLRAEHPALYAQIVGIGANQERERVNAHLILGEGSGDLKTAIAAIKDGSELTATLHATYLAAGMNRKDRQDAAADDAETAAAADAAANISDAAAADAGDALWGSVQSSATANLIL